MGMNKLWTGALIGAVVGAAVTLFDTETRNDVVRGVTGTSQKVKQYVQHPSYSLEILSQKYHRSMSNLSKRANDLLYVMDQVQYVLERIESIEGERKN